MALEKEKLSQPENKPEKKLNLSEDFDNWLKLDKQRNSVETKSQLADLKEDISDKLWFKDPLKILTETSEKSASISQKIGSWEFSAFVPIQTRISGSENGTVAGAFFDSASVLANLTKDMIIDFWKLIVSPWEQFRNVLTDRDDKYFG